MKDYFVHIMANQSRGTLYIGVTGNLAQRYAQHSSKVVKSFTAKHQLTRLVYYEHTESVETALEREKQLKRWHRQWKINLIESINPEWKDLSYSLGVDAETSSA